MLTKTYQRPASTKKKPLPMSATKTLPNIGQKIVTIDANKKNPS